MNDLLVERIKISKNDPIFYEKEDGIWKMYTYKYFFDQVRKVATGLKNLSLEIGDKVCISGNFINYIR
jgi:long-subunit acyl-CoA synthetase (AMP-forming)